jgi:diadenosine tetraphosphate (Ap4A) HIT family hydrolase
LPSQQQCSACAEIAGQVLAPGGVIHDDGLWFVSHHTGRQTDPGELIVKTHRHCESLAELTPEEADALGPVLHSAIEALEGVVVAERIYAVSFNERVRHVHFLLLPRTAAMPPGHVISDLYRRARNLLRRFGLVRNPTSAQRAEVADRIRTAWRASRAGDGAPSGVKLGSRMREARLRPEFAHLYPTLTPGQWEPAARVAEVVLARLLLLEISEAPMHDRVLNEEHFEFRGETPDGAPRSSAASRAADKKER